MSTPVVFGVYFRSRGVFLSGEGVFMRRGRMKISLVNPEASGIRLHVGMFTLTAPRVTNFMRHYWCLLHVRQLHWNSDMTILKYEEIKQCVEDNNKSKSLSNEFVICLVWKESGFNYTIKNSKSSASGLMQVTKAAVSEVNKNYKTSYTHEEMVSDTGKNIQCGTYYLDLRIKWAKNKTKGIEGFGTGAGYAKNIFTCEECLAKNKEHSQDCLDKIHK